VAIVEAVFLIVFWSWVITAVFFLRTTFLIPDPIHITPETAGLAFETVSFNATDGTALEGWKIVADYARPWIIGCHGLGSNRSDLLEIAAMLHKARFNVFLFDFRAHGGSGGRFTSFGLTEQRDLEGALSFLGNQVEIAPSPYGIYGISLGASVALMTAARDERLYAIAIDSPYSDLQATLARHQKLMYPGLPKQPFLGFIAFTYRLRFGLWPAVVSPAQSAGKLGHRPVLLIAGAEDVRMPAEDMEKIRDAHSAAEYWRIEGVGHLEGFAASPAKYARRLVAFFKNQLGVGPL